MARHKRPIQLDRYRADFSRRYRCGRAWRRSGDDRLSVPNDRQAPPGLWIAKDAGFFERQGLDVKIVFVEGSPRTMQTLIAGESQIVESTGPAVLNARAAGSPVVIVAGYVNVMPYYLIVDNSINSPADLKGKVGANHMPGTAADTVIRIGLKALGLDPDRDASLGASGNTPMRLQAMSAGAAQFMVAQDLELVQAKRLGFKLLVDYVANKTPFPMGGAVTTQRYAKEQRDTVLRYVKAMAQALHYLKTNRGGSLSSHLPLRAFPECRADGSRVRCRPASVQRDPYAADRRIRSRCQGTCPAQSEATRCRHEICSGLAVCQRARAKRLSEKP